MGTQDGRATITAREPEELRQTVYNLEIRGDHTYYVSDAKLWVHNSCLKPDWVTNPGSFCKWMENLQEEAKAVAKAGGIPAKLTAEEAREVVTMAKDLGVKVTSHAPHGGSVAAPWDTMSHLHFGDGRFHVPCPDGFVP